MRSTALILASTAMFASATKLQAQAEAEAARMTWPPENEECDWHGHCCTESGACSYNWSEDRYAYTGELPDYVPGEWPDFWCTGNSYWSSCFSDSKAPHYMYEDYLTRD